MTTPAPPASPATPANAASHENLPERIGLSRGNVSVVGLQWGDEGKGQLVDVLTRSFDATVRYNGGNNAGHSVYIGDEKFALHLLPSGILYPDKLNVVGNGVVIDPSPETGILKEILGLREQGVKVDGENLRISSRAHVVLPYHKVQDALFDGAMAKQWDTGAAIGTTGRGIGPCYADKATRSTAVRMGDLLEPDRLRRNLKAIVAVKNTILSALAAECGQAFEPFDADAIAAQAISWGEQLRPHICDTRELLYDMLTRGRRLLFEGANAVLLDVDHGTYPYVTSSSCSSLGVPTGTGLPARHVQEVIGVAKMYTSRVGGGPHPTQLDDETGRHIQNVGKEFGTTTGRPRRCGWLDLTAVRYAAQLNGCTALCCTGLSVLADLPGVKICTGYRYRGEQLTSFPPDADILAEAEPIYETLEGFRGPIGDVTDYDELPATAKAYINKVESFVGVPVKLVCVGPKRSQMLVR